MEKPHIRNWAIVEKVGLQVKERVTVLQRGLSGWHFRNGGGLYVALTVFAGYEWLELVKTRWNFILTEVCLDLTWVILSKGLYKLNPPTKKQAMN